MCVRIRLLSVAARGWAWFLSLVLRIFWKGKQSNHTPIMYEAPGQRYDKNLKYCPICLWQNVVIFQKTTWRKLFHTLSTSWKLGCKWQITSAFAWCSMWVACPATARAGGRKRTCFRCRWPLMRVYDMLVLSSFSNKFNIVSALFVHQPLTLPQKIDSREGWFWWKKGLAYECSKMNFYLKKAAICTRFWAVCR